MWNDISEHLHGLRMCFVFETQSEDFSPWEDAAAAAAAAAAVCLIQTLRNVQSQLNLIHAGPFVIFVWTVSGNREKITGEVKLCLCKEWEISNSVLFGSLMTILFKKKKKIAITQENTCVTEYLFPRMGVVRGVATGSLTKK